MRLNPVTKMATRRISDWSNCPYVNWWSDDRQLNLNAN